LVCFFCILVPFNIGFDNLILGKNPNRTYVGVFDGYEGSVSSELCADQLHFGLVKNLSKFDSSMELKLDFKEYDEINHLDKYEIPIHYQNEQVNKANNASDDDEDDTNDKHLKNIRNAFYCTYKQMDKLLSRGKNEKSRVRWSGATGATCFIEHIDENNTWLHMANCGKIPLITCTKWFLTNHTKTCCEFFLQTVFDKSRLGLRLMR
jgi:hypothetical protein